MSQSIIKSDLQTMHLPGSDAERLQRELDELIQRLAECEAELRAMQREWHAFRRRYMETLGARYAELEAVERMIAELNPQPNSTNTGTTTFVEDEDATDDEEADEELPPSLQKLPGVRRIFWRIAKLFHPDHAANDEERQRRHVVMAEASRLYQQGDQERLSALLDHGAHAPQYLEGSTEARLQSDITRTRERLHGVETEMRSMTESQFYALKLKCDHAAEKNRDLLAEMSRHIAKQTTYAMRRLEMLRQLD